MREIIDLLEAKLRQTDIDGHMLPLNADGTVTLYHATSDSAAHAIVRTGMLRSAGEPSVYFSTAQTGTGYGDVVVSMRLMPNQLRIDDEFPDGRVDFRIDQPVVRVKSAKIVKSLVS